jgi:hypothetical protein
MIEINLKFLKNNDFRISKLKKKKDGHLRCFCNYESLDGEK